MKKLMIGVVIGLVLGLWFGVNIGKDRPFYTNPFQEQTLGEIIGQKSEKVLQEGGKALQDSGHALRKKLAPPPEE